MIINIYNLLLTDSMKGVRVCLMVMPIVSIFIFSSFVSNSTSNFIAFFAFTSSVTFIGISFWMLGWILSKDAGTQAMKEIGDPIKEGAEGFFKT